MLYRNIFVIGMLLFMTTLRSAECRNDLVVVESETNVVKNVEVSIRSINKYSDRWEIEIETHNKSQDAVYILTDPKKASGESGPYIDVTENNSTTLTLSTRFYEGPSYFLYVNVTSVKLLRLEPYSSHVEKNTLQFPLELTVPPYGKSLGERKRKIDYTKIKTIEIFIGILPDDEGIKEIAQRKPLKQFSNTFSEGEVNGVEIVTKGSFKSKALINAQEIISTSYKLEDNTETKLER